jgi:hypothetical protein
MLEGFTHARLACGCSLMFREGVKGSPVTVIIEKNLQSALLTCMFKTFQFMTIASLFVHQPVLYLLNKKVVKKKVDLFNLLLNIT